MSSMRKAFLLFLTFFAGFTLATGGASLVNQTSKGVSQLSFTHDEKNMMAGTPEGAVLDLAVTLEEKPAYVLIRHMLFWGETDLANKFLAHRLRKKKEAAFAFGDMGYGKLHAFSYICYAYAIKSGFCERIVTDFVKTAASEELIPLGIYPIYIFSSPPEGERTFMAQDNGAIARACLFSSHRQRLVIAVSLCQSLLVAEQVKALYRNDCAYVKSTELDVDDFDMPWAREIGEAAYSTCGQNKDIQFFEKKLSEMGYDKFLKIGSEDYLEMAVRILYWN